MSALRNAIAATVIGLAGTAGTVATADAATLRVQPPVRHQFCIPHMESKIVRFHYRLYRVVIHVDRHCRQHVVRIVPLSRFHAAR